MAAAAGCPRWRTHSSGESDQETCFLCLIGATPCFFCCPFLYKITPFRQPWSENCWNQVPEGNLLKTVPILSFCKVKYVYPVDEQPDRLSALRRNKNAPTAPKTEVTTGTTAGVCCVLL